MIETYESIKEELMEDHEHITERGIILVPAWTAKHCVDDGIESVLNWLVLFHPEVFKKTERLGADVDDWIYEYRETTCSDIHKKQTERDR